MILVTSRFRVANGMEAEVARAFRERPHLVDDEDGFLGMEVFTAAEDPTVFDLVTRWTDAESYRSWHHGESHRLSHAWIPKGLKLDAAFTAVKIANRLVEPSLLPGEEETVLDHGALIASFLAESDVICTLRCDRDGRVIRMNEAFALLLGRPVAEVTGEPVWPYLVASEADRMRERLRGGRRAPRERFLAHFVSVSQVPFSLSCQIDVQPGYATLLGEPPVTPLNVDSSLLDLNNELSVLARENARKNRELDRARNDLQAALDELNASYWHLRKIQEFLPICVDCGKVKTAEANWESVAEYLKKHSLFLSHGYCPDCARRVLAQAEKELGEP